MKKKKYCIVKRKGHEEEFDDRKVYNTCYAACLSAHTPYKEAEQICKRVSKDMKKWVRSRKVVTSDQIFKKTVLLLQKLDENAAFMYATHRDIS